jgi:hypothetical protein
MLRCFNFHLLIGPSIFSHYETKIVQPPLKQARSGRPQGGRSVAVSVPLRYPMLYARQEVFVSLFTMLKIIITN